MQHSHSFFLTPLPSPTAPSPPHLPILMKCYPLFPSTDAAWSASGFIPARTSLDVKTSSCLPLTRLVVPHILGLDPTSGQSTEGVHDTTGYKSVAFKGLALQPNVAVWDSITRRLQIYRVTPFLDMAGNEILWKRLERRSGHSFVSLLSDLELSFVSLCLLKTAWSFFILSTLEVHYTTETGPLAPESVPTNGHHTPALSPH